MVKKINWELADLLQNLSNAISDREGRTSIHLDTDEYLNGVKKAIPQIEKRLNDLKSYLKFPTLNEIMGAEEASELWNLSPSYIKDLCAKDKIKCKKIGKTWVIDKNQPNPSKK